MSSFRTYTNIVYYDFTHKPIFYEKEFYILEDGYLYKELKVFQKKSDIKVKEAIERWKRRNFVLI